MAEKLSYEKAREELTKVVEQLESGSATLEESLKLWERGEDLAKICQDLLDGAKAKIENNKEKPAKWVLITQNYYLLVKMKPNIA